MNKNRNLKVAKLIFVNIKESATLTSNEELIVESIIGNLTKVTLLLQSNETYINTYDNFQRTALLWASTRGHAEVVEYLLNNSNIYANMADTGAWNPLLLATKYGHGDVVSLLIGHPAVDVNFAQTIENGETSLHVASQKGYLEIGKFLLQHPMIDVNIGLMNTGATPMHVASVNGNLAVINELLKHPLIDVNSRLITNGATALYVAAQKRQEEVVRSLVGHPKVSVNIGTLRQMTPLMEASSSGEPDIVKLLLALVNIDVNHATIDGKTALFFAVLARDTKSLELILRCPKVDTNLMDEEYKTAQDRAEADNLMDLIRLFGDRGYLQITKGHTCCSDKANLGLHIAVGNNDLPWINTFLICPKLDINIPTKNGSTALNVAAEKGFTGVVEVLLNDIRIEVNKPNTGQMQNAIIIAATQCHMNILKMLLKHPQTFVNQQDTNGQSALTLAWQRYREIKEYKDFRVAKLILRCPKTSFTNALLEEAESDSIEIDYALHLNSDSKMIVHTCCVNVKQGLLDAAWVGDYKAIKGLLQCPTSEMKVNEVDKKGRTPLYIASMMGHYLAVEVLLTKPSINVNIQVPFDGSTTFSIASERSHFEVLKSLIVNSESDKNKGWCRDNWSTRNKCTSAKVSHQSTTPPITTSESGNQIKFCSGLAQMSRKCPLLRKVFFFVP